MHYLIDYHLQELLDFLVAVSGGKPWRKAWADEISLPPGAIDDALNRYHQRAKYGLWKVKAKPPDMDDFADSIAPVADVLA